MVAVVRKNPADQLDYDFDFSKWITDDDILISGDAVVDPAGELTVVSVQLSDTVVKVWLSGGADGKTYTLTVYATTAHGRQKEYPIYVRVTECVCS